MSAQLRLPVDPGTRLPYPTGLQVPCVGCAAAGVDRLGIPRDGPDPLCMRCWTGRRQRARQRELRELRAQLWEGLGAAEAAADCEACGSDIPSRQCWRCGDARELAEFRALFEADQAAAELAEQQAQEQRFAILAELTAAEVAAERAETLVRSCRAVLDAAGYGRLRPTPLVLLSAAFARLGTPGGRGRPPVWPIAAAKVALVADHRGRGSRPGREETATTAGYSQRAVQHAWKLLEDVGWMTRTVQGRLATLAERKRLGVHRLRAEFDVTGVQHGPTPQREHYLAALQVFARLYAALVDQHEQARRLVDELRERAGAAPDVAEYEHRARLRAAVATISADIDELISSPHPVGAKELSTCSCLYLGSLPSQRENSPPGRGTGRPAAAGTAIRATRPPTGGTRPACAHCLPHPRTLRGWGAPPRVRRRASRPPWADWAPILARDLREHWPWLRDRSLRGVAAALGARLGPDWTAAGLVAWIARQRRRPVLDVVNDPAAYVCCLLDETLTGLDEPPERARLHDERRRQLVVDERAELRAAAAERRAELDARDAAAAARRERLSGTDPGPS